MSTLRSKAVLRRRRPRSDDVVVHRQGEIDALEDFRTEAQRLGDWAKEVDCCERQLAIRPDLILPRLRIAWHATRTTGALFAESDLDVCIENAVGSAQVDHRLVHQLLWNIQQSPDASRRDPRLRQLLAVVEAAPVESLGDDVRAAQRARVLLALGDRTGFVDTVRRLPPLAGVDAAVRRLVRDLVGIAERWEDERHPDHLASRVFVIGLSRTGTSSMDAALGVLGFSHLHWINHVTMDLIRPADLYVFDAFSDVGITADFEALAYRFPNARFVMTTRPYDSWVVSVRRHFARQAGVEHPSQLVDSPLARTFRGMKGWIEASVYGHHETWADAYAAHERRVAEFFTGGRSERLLRFDATAGDGWSSLCAFLDRPLPKVAYPHTNQGRPVPSSGDRSGS